MNGRSLTMQTAAALTGLMLSAMVADAAEVKVFTSVALTNALDELAPIFEQKTGNKLKISYDLAAVQKKRILDGERADVIILTRVMMDDLAKQNKLAPSHVRCRGERTKPGRGPRSQFDPLRKSKFHPLG